jgi:hypothetical protein
MTYQSRSATILKATTDHMPAVWTPERGWHDSCQYDSGAMTECRPLCDRPATHAVIYHNGTSGPFTARVCDRHLSPMLGRVYPGHERTESL